MSVPCYRQTPIGTYIVDFYCPSRSLIIELDGGQHFEEDARLYDEKRTAYLEHQGLSVVRFTNREIWTNFRGVCEMSESLLTG